MKKQYLVALTAEERASLHALLRKGVAPARKLTRARILLRADEGGADRTIAAGLDIHPRTVECTRRCFVEGGLAQALHDKPRPGGRPKLDDHPEAVLVALACSQPPEGYARWTIQLLADRLVELQVVEAISDETLRRTLKNALKPWRKKHWCIAQVGADFVWRMEDILDLYAQSYDLQWPVVCFDEQPQHLLAETRPPLPAAPGRPERVDDEYRRGGTANLFLFFDPKAGWRHVEVSEHRTAGDFAQQMKALIDVHHPQARRIAVVRDNLSTHSPAALYQTFPPAEAFRLMQRLDFHYTPKHGSWLNMAELEFSRLDRQCLDRRISDLESLRCETAAWEQRRNAERATAHWHFTVDKARTKLHHLYPT